MLKKPGRYVLTSLRARRDNGAFEEVGSSEDLSVRQEPSKGRTGHTKCGMYLLAPSLAATFRVNGASRRAEEGGCGLPRLSEHPAGL